MKKRQQNYRTKRDLRKNGLNIKISKYKDKTSEIKVEKCNFTNKKNTRDKSRNRTFRNILFNLKSGEWLERKTTEDEETKRLSRHSLEVVKIEKTFKKNKILKACSFKIKKGSFHALVGENGAGKTTLIKTIIGGFPIEKGKILFNGLDVEKNIQEKNILSYVPEKAIFPNNMNLYAYLKLIWKLKGKELDNMDKQIKHLLNQFDLMDRKNINPNRLSSGQKKKIFLIKILIEKPEIIILDEPAANLDPTARFLFFEELKKINAQGVTVLITSHIISEISKYVNGATFIRKGEIVFTGDIEKDKLEEKFQEIVINDQMNNRMVVDYE
ncbi:ABC transporter ATP-binding protein [Mycoplasma marinum]|uniref:Multidrug ABC transporter ATP-binding protein n=1 Tax=Mycoplasma marinum TaxID=1937190 RepID=A0A4R0XLL9_9MOLU|nr:ABC transporter ATP-binding protein [Mycoplasma marinum]TCG11374.1 multidrug ABC transporter ATP-binding protein [Mycoplasma marinum]